MKNNNLFEDNFNFILATKITMKNMQKLLQNYYNSDIKCGGGLINGEMTDVFFIDNSKIGITDHNKYIIEALENTFDITIDEIFHRTDTNDIYIIYKNEPHLIKSETHTKEKKKAKNWIKIKTRKSDR